MPRATPFDKAIAERCAAILQRGLAEKDAYLAGGISKTTFYKWLKDGLRHSRRRESGKEISAGEAALADFADSITRANAEGKVLLVEKLHGIATGKQTPESVKALMFLLERRYPEEFGRRYIRLEQSGPGGGPIETETRVRLTIDDKGASEDLPVETVAEEEPGDQG